MIFIDFLFLSVNLVYICDKVKMYCSMFSAMTNSSVCIMSQSSRMNYGCIYSFLACNFKVGCVSFVCLGSCHLRSVNLRG